MWWWIFLAQKKILAQLIKWNGNESNPIGNLLQNIICPVCGVVYECSRMKCPNHQGRLKGTAKQPAARRPPNIMGFRKTWLISRFYINSLLCKFLHCLTNIIISGLCIDRDCNFIFYVWPETVFKSPWAEPWNMVFKMIAKNGQFSPWFQR